MGLAIGPHLGCYSPRPLPQLPSLIPLAFSATAPTLFPRYFRPDFAPKRDTDKPAVRGIRIAT